MKFSYVKIHLNLVTPSKVLSFIPYCVVGVWVFTVRDLCTVKALKNLRVALKGPYFSELQTSCAFGMEMKLFLSGFRN